MVILQALAAFDMTARRLGLLTAAVALSALVHLTAVLPVLASPGGLPVRVQAQLLAKVAEYDRSLTSRSGERTILLVARRGSAGSIAQASALGRELAQFSQIGGGAHKERVLEVGSAAEVGGAAREAGAAMVYLSSDLLDLVPGIAEALSGVTVLSVGSASGYAEKGAVLGLEEESGRAQLVVNLPQSKRQNIAFRAAFLNLARVIR
jgi:hypothetical protein